jgi:hypothetical protein
MLQKRFLIERIRLAANTKISEIINHEVIQCPVWGEFLEKKLKTGKYKGLQVNGMKYLLEECRDVQASGYRNTAPINTVDVPIEGILGDEVVRTLRKEYSEVQNSYTSLKTKAREQVIANMNDLIEQVQGISAHPTTALVKAFEETA